LLLLKQGTFWPWHNCSGLQIWEASWVGSSRIQDSWELRRSMERLDRRSNGNSILQTPKPNVLHFLMLFITSDHLGCFANKYWWFENFWSVCIVSAHLEQENVSLKTLAKQQHKLAFGIKMGRFLLDENLIPFITHCRDAI